MKIGLFTDAHYSSRSPVGSRRQNSRSLEKLKTAYAFFAKHGCKLCVSLGDLIDWDESREAEINNLKAIGELISASGIETICLMGNHDAFTFEKIDFYRILGGCEPNERVIDGKRLIFLDTCFFEDGTSYTPDGGDWTDCFLPNGNELLARLNESEQRCIVFLHHNIDPAVPNDHRLANADLLFEGIRDSQKVDMVLQGHYHRGMISRYDGTDYLTLPAVCENERAFFVFDTEINRN